MFDRRTLKLLAAFVCGYFLLLVPGAIWPAYLDTPMGILVMAPLLCCYLLAYLGVPGLLQNNGACGWGWCAPTALGWLVSVMVCLVGLWLLAWLLAPSTAEPQADP
ncbi:MAG: hypothetical protein LCH73_04140 [Proteobacteria bacterium]|nr:hypothetical protein [Pseudomonadota bacterium]